MKFKYLFYFPIGISLLTSTWVSAEDTNSLNIPSEIVKSQSYERNFKVAAFANPAAKFFQQDYSLTSLYFNGISEDASDFKIAPMGKANSFWSIKAESQLKLDKNNLVWGEASYTNGKRKDVNWNETSDFELLYPYVMGDDYVGDLKYEEYFLDGGYAGYFNNWTFGAKLCYRARCEYRQVDPRPNNVVADLKAQLAVGYTFGKYNLSLALQAGKYKQTNDLKYFNELGASKEYHLTGIGNEFVRFSGACNDVFYKGHNFGASLEFVPTTLKGFSASVLFDKFSFDKILSSLNKLALNHLYENKIQTEIAWTNQSAMNADYGVKLDFTYAKRIGNDNMFGDATGNVYPQIGTTLMFDNKKLNGRISGFYEQTINHNIPLGISPFIGYQNYTSLHTSSNNEFNCSNLFVGTGLKAAYIKGRNLFQIKIDASYRIGTSTELIVAEDEVCHASMLKMLNHTADYLKANETNTNISLRYQIKLRPKTLSYFIEASWGHRFYLNNQNDNQYIVTTGICL